MTSLRDKEIEALAYFFAFWWAVLVLEPRHNRSTRNLLADLGLVRPRGALALTAAGERVMKYSREEGRPRYARLKPKRVRKP